MLALPPALAAFGARAQFVTWIALPKADGLGKFDKLPCDWRTGDVINAQDPTFWTDHATACSMAVAWDRGYGSGAGFVITAADPFWFLDGDSMLLPDGQWSPLAHELTARLGPAACEVSHSGRGLHWFGTMRAPFEHACKNTPLGLELYTSGRFVALTGTSAQGDAGADCTDALALIAAQYFPPSVTGDFAGWTDEPVPEWDGPDDDDELIRRARISGQRSAARAFGSDDTKPSFEQLWSADPVALGRAWPHTSRPYDASNADMALANHLAFWTGKNCVRIERLMRRSGLVRDKWDTHRTYVGDTILKACAYTTNVSTKRDAPAPVVVEPPPPEVLAAAAQHIGRQNRDPNNEYMGPVEQLQHFAGCFYLSDNEKIFSMQHNAIMGKGAFDVRFGGHLFVMDPIGSKTTTSAWEAFTESRVFFPSAVDTLCFRPELPPEAIVREGAKSWVNSYVPYDCPSAPGDVSLWTEYLAKILPVYEDRVLLEHYMSSMIQNKGVKFQWWPVIQGVPGNAKTLICEVIRYAIGEQYSHLPNSAAMARDGMKFNSWIDRKLFIGVEEIMLGTKREFLDEFKPIVTNRRIPMEGKGTNQTNGDNRANGILLTNHPDGVPIAKNERRYGMFYTAQQEDEHLVRDGMNSEYFSRLFTWVREGGGFSAIAHWFKTYPLQAELDPARGLQRAPVTSSTHTAMRYSLGKAEQEVVDAIEEGRPGFAGGWVSSKFLDRLLEDVRAHVPRTKRRDMMAALGYVWHPSLPEGRAVEVLHPDGVRPKLYIKVGHPANDLTDPYKVGQHYARAQEPAAVSTGAVARIFG